MKIKAGRTDIDCGTIIKITQIAGDDPDDRMIEGMTGKITHPFPGLMTEDPEQYIAGVYLESPSNGQITIVGGITNLMVGDTFEVIDASTAEEYPDWTG